MIQMTCSRREVYGAQKCSEINIFSNLKLCFSLYLRVQTMENYTVKKALGQGTWGVVHMAEQKGTSRIVAIKKIKSERPDEGVNFTAVREIKLLREFKHENIIELVDCFTTPDQAVCLVYECADTDLEKIIQNRSIPISMADTKQHMLTLLRAIEVCHEHWILHRDLKPDNMLYIKDGTMKLADFGLARMFGTPKTRLSPQAITLWYKPPELLLGASEYSSAADMWSCGCIFAELLLRRPFLQGKNSDISQLDTIFTVFGTPSEYVLGLVLSLCILFTLSHCLFYNPTLIEQTGRIIKRFLFLLAD